MMSPIWAVQWYAKQKQKKKKEEKKMRTMKSIFHCHMTSQSSSVEVEHIRTMISEQCEKQR